MDSGIYAIINKVNGKRYYGSSRRLRARIRRHRLMLRNNQHHNDHLQNAWNKYGNDAFEFRTMIYCDECNLLFYEKTFIDHNPDGYNICKDPVGRTHSPETREKLRQVNLGKTASPETREKMGLSHRGKKQSPEHIEKRRQANLTPENIEKNRQAHLGRTQSPETIAKIRQSQLGRKKSPEQVEKNRQSHLGKKLSPEHIEKLRQLGFNQSVEKREKIRQAGLGRKHTAESIDKVRCIAKSRTRCPQGRFRKADD